MNVVVAVDDPQGGELAAGLAAAGITVSAHVGGVALALLAHDRTPEDELDDLAVALVDTDIIVLQTSRSTLTAAVVAFCDRRGIRIAPLCGGAADERLAASFGLPSPHPLDVDARRLAAALSEEPTAGDDAASAAPRVVAVWGPAGAPGRTTVAIELAVELARGGRHVGLVDADTHAPAVALTLGLPDEGPGFAAACRHGDLGGLDARELARISVPLGRTGVDVLTGLNRPSRWPELGERRVADALAVCREWADDTVVDVASSLERDEEIVSDLDGPRRNAATLAALRAADLVVAVASADPLGLSRFLRAYADLRSTIGTTPVAVIANRLRPGTLGIDARGQVRRTLERFGGISDVWFLPADARSVDAAILAARPIAEVVPRSPFALALRRFVGEAVAPPVAIAAAPATRRSRRVNRRDRLSA